jgi:hypothetical protein
LAASGVTIAVSGTLVGGSGYTNGAYSNVQASLASGTPMSVYPIFQNIFVTSGAVSLASNPSGQKGGDLTTVLTVSNTLIGGTGSGFTISAGSLLTPVNNVAVGLQSLSQLYTATDNTSIGNSALQSLVKGNYNVAMGSLAGQFLGAAGFGTTTANTYVGYLSGQNSIGGNYNTYLGSYTGSNSNTYITALGTITGGSGYTNGTYTSVNMTVLSGRVGSGPQVTIVVSGGAVTSITLPTTPNLLGPGCDTTTVLTASAALIGGTGSGFSVPVSSISTPSFNVFVGANAGLSNYGTGNVAVGQSAGGGVAMKGNYNVFLGYQAGANETGSNKLYIANTSTATPLIGGDFTAGTVTINGALADSFFYATTGLYAAPLKNSTSAQPLFGGFVSATGTLGTPTGTGPWTVVITGMSNAGGFQVGTTITATAGTGSFNTNTITIVSIDSATGMTVSATGGTIPTAGTVTNITSTTAGALTLAANTEYQFELILNGANTGSSTKIFSVTGTATYGKFFMQAHTIVAAAAAANSTPVSSWNNATTPTITFISTASATAFATLIKGVFRTTAGGTFIPNITFSVGGTATLAQATLRVTPTTAGTTFTIGTWA